MFMLMDEPSVLCNLQYRYHRDVIYTMARPVQLAINPFKDVLVYGSDVIMAYREKILDSPHVYAIADAAYSDMMRGIRLNSEYHKDDPWKKQLARALLVNELTYGGVDIPLPLNKDVLQWANKTRDQTMFVAS
ncbi:myosin-2 isoform X1 [Tanacetum coccineum]